MSHPTWVRGLKCAEVCGMVRSGKVAPHVGAWIEIYRAAYRTAYPDVAPHVGAWIEIPEILKMSPARFSRTPRGCVD